MQSMLKIILILAMVTFVSNAWAKNTVIKVDGTIKYELGSQEDQNDAEVLAIYYQKNMLAEEAADKLIAYGLSGTKEEVASAVLTSQEFTIGDVVNTGAVIAIPVYLTVNAKEIGTIIAGNSTCWKRLTCKWSLELMRMFEKAMSCKKQGKYDGDYQHAVDRARTLQNYVIGVRDEHGVAYSSAAVKSEPDNAIVHTGQAKALANEGDMEGAEKSTKEALALEPGLLESYIVLGNAYFKSGDYDKAVFQYRKAIKIDPTYSLGYYRLSNAYSKMGKKDLANENMQLAAKYNTTLTAEVKEAAEANKDADTASDNGESGRGTVSPEIQEVIEVRKKAQEYRKAGNYAKAISVLEAHNSKDPDYGNYYVMYDLGLTYNKMKQYKMSNEILGGIWSMHPCAVALMTQNYEAMKNYDEALHILRLYEKKPELMEELKEKFPNTYIGVQQKYGRLCLIKGLPEEALMHIDLSIEAKPNFKSFGFRGLILEKMKRYSKAEAAYMEALKFKPNNKHITKYLKRVRSKL